MNVHNVESMSRMAFRLERDARLVSAAQDDFFRNRGLSRAVVATWPEKSRDVLNRQWSVSSECARLHSDLARVDDLPCADHGLESWRYPSPYGGWIMIGARDAQEALSEARRSIDSEPDASRLERWQWSERAYVRA